MFGERKTKLTLLSLLSALVVISTAFVGVSIYAQEAGVDDSELTTFEEEELRAEEEDAEMSSADDEDAADGETAIAEVRTLFDGLVVCDTGDVTVDEPETEIAGLDDATAATPTVSVSIMTETEVAAIAENETETASADETETASADCFRIGSADDDEEETSTSSDATPTGDNATSADGSSELTSEEASNDTSITMPASDVSLLDTEQQIMVIEGQDFVPGQVVLVFSSNALLAIDEVDEEGSIDAKVPVTEVDNEIRFVESGTMRTADFAFDGETLIAAEGVGEIQAESSKEESMTAAPSGNEEASTDNSTDDDTNGNSTEQ